MHFLPHIEDGTVIFIGATTENPSFELNNALLSRTRVYVLKSLTTAEIEQVLQQAVEDPERGLGKERLIFRREFTASTCRICQWRCAISLELPRINGRYGR